MSKQYISQDAKIYFLGGGGLYQDAKIYFLGGGGLYQDANAQMSPLVRPHSATQTFDILAKGRGVHMKGVDEVVHLKFLTLSIL